MGKNKIRTIWFAACALLLSACSSQFAYNNLDWLIHWYLDDYIDLNKVQKQTFDGQFAQWMQWHRTEELAKYQQHLEEIKGLLKQDSMTQQQVSAQFDLGRQHWERLRTHLVPELSQLALLLNEQQVIELFDSLEERNVEQEEERLEMTQEEMLVSFEENFEDDLKEYFGRLTSKQKALIKETVANIIPNRLEWIKYRRAVQTVARELLMERHSNPNFTGEFASLLNNPEALKHELYIQNSAHNRRVFAQLVADAFVTITPKQKKRLFRKIDNLIADLMELQEYD